MMQEQKKSCGKIFVLFGPAGVGKTTLLRAVCAGFSVTLLRPVCTVTTRPKRDGEIEGYSYFFVTKEQFLAMEQVGKFFETATFMGHLYATPLSEFELLAQGQNLIVATELEGLLKLCALPQTVPILLQAPKKILEDRICSRQQGICVTKVRERLELDFAQVEKARSLVQFAFTIENIVLEEALALLRQAILSVIQGGCARS